MQMRDVFVFVIVKDTFLNKLPKFESCLMLSLGLKYFKCPGSEFGKPKA